MHLVATGKGEEVYAAAEALISELEAAGLSAIYDDRPKVSPGVKFGDAELLGVPMLVTVGRGLKNGTIELKDRRSGESREVPVAEAAAAVLEHVKGLR